MDLIIFLRVCVSIFPRFCVKVALRDDAFGVGVSRLEYGNKIVIKSKNLIKIT